MAQPIASPGPRDTQDRRAAPADPDRRWLVLLVVAVAQLMVVLDATVVNIALPSAQHALGFGNNDRQWVVTGYALAFGSLLLVGGRLGDMYSRKWVFITGLIGFAVASAIGRERGRAFAVFGSVASGGAGVGLILGGVLTQYLSWRYTLYVNLVFAAFAIAGALAWIRSSRPATRPRLDWPGTVLASAGLFLIVFGFSRAETAGWAAPLTIGSLVAGPLLLAAFVVAERRSAQPLLPLRVILDRTRGGSYAVLGLTGIALFGVFLFLAYYLQGVKGYSPVTSGLLFLPFVGGILVSSTVSSIVALPRVGPRALIASGMLLSTGAMAYLTQLTVTSTYAAVILPAVIVMGLGFGVIFAVTINTATAGVRRQDAGVASALVNTMQQVGGSIGLSALSTVALTATASYLAAHHTGRLAPAIAATRGYTTAFAVAAAILGLGVILAVVLLPSRRRIAELRTGAAEPTPAPAPQPEPAPQAIPVALSGCSPVIDPGLPPAAARPSL